MEGPECLAAVLGLIERLSMAPPVGLAPDCVEDVVNLCGIRNKGSLEGSVGLQGVVVLCKNFSAQVNLEDRHAGYELIVY